MILTKAATERALPSLLGMALDYAPLDGHDAQRKIGIITAVGPGREMQACGGGLSVRARLSGSGEGDRAAREALGMTYEIANAGVLKQDARCGR